jgi:hypothetical protein
VYADCILHGPAAGGGFDSLWALDGIQPRAKSGFDLIALLLKTSIPKSMPKSVGVVEIIVAM